MASGPSHDGAGAPSGGGEGASGAAAGPRYRRAEGVPDDLACQYCDGDEEDSANPLFVCDYLGPNADEPCGAGFHHNCRYSTSQTQPPLPRVGEPAYCNDDHAAAGAAQGVRLCQLCEAPFAIPDRRRKRCLKCSPAGGSGNSQPASPRNTPRRGGARPSAGGASGGGRGSQEDGRPAAPRVPRPAAPKADYATLGADIPWDAMLDAAGEGHASAMDGVLSLLADLDLPAPPAVNNLPKNARPALRAAWAAVGEAIVSAHTAWVDDQSDGRLARLGLVWAVFLLFGHWFLCASPPLGARAQRTPGPSLTEYLREGVDMLRVGDLPGLRARAARRAAASAVARAAREATSPVPDADASCTTARVAKAASYLIRAGGHHGVRRGVARCGSAAPMAPAVAEGADALRRLHPPAPPPTDERVASLEGQMAQVRTFSLLGSALPLPDGETPAERVLQDCLRFKQAVAAARGKAAGPDAITADILYQIVADCRACQSTTMAVIRLIQDGKCPPFVTARLAAARLIGLPKPGSTALHPILRPIAVASLLRRIAASLLVRHYKKEVEEAVGPHQFGFCQAGREAVYLTLAATLQEHPEWTLLELDVRNAFNEALREAMLVECCTRLPQLLPMARAFYLQPSDLLFRCSDASLIKLTSASGSQQGDPFGGVLFDLALRPILDELAREFPFLVHAAFQDNMYLVGPVEQLISAAAWLRTRLTRVCLVLKPAGYHAWSPTAMSVPHRASLVSLGIPTASVCEAGGGFVVLGAPFGHPTYVAEAARSTVASALAILESPIFRSLDTQAQWLGLFYSVSRRVNHLARFVAPALLEPAERLAREKFHAYACSFFRVEAPLSVTVQLLLELPLRLGGMGLRFFTREPAYLAGMLAARATLRTRFELMTLPDCDLSVEDRSRLSSVVLKEAVESAFLQSRVTGAALAAAFTRLRGIEAAVAADVERRSLLMLAIRGDPAWERLLDPAEPSPTLEKLIPHPNDDPPKDLQWHLTVLLHEDARLAFSRVAPLVDDIIRVNQSGPSAAAWMLAFPGGPSSPAYRQCLRWPGSTFLTVLQYRLGVPLSVLIAAGVPAGGAPCWLSRGPCGQAAGGAQPAGSAGAPMIEEAATNDAAAAAAAAAVAAAAAAAAAAAVADDDTDDAPREEGARGDLPPSPPRVHRLGASGSRSAAAHPIASASPPRRQATPQPVAVRRPHDHARCGPHARRWVSQQGRELPLCVNGGGPTKTHDGVADALAHLAPSGPPSEWPGADRHPTARHIAVAYREQSMAPGTKWNVVDVASHGDVFTDVTLAHPACNSRVLENPGGDARSCVLNTMFREETEKLKHYAREREPGGPFAPGKGVFVPFVVSDRGLLSPAASRLVQSFAKRRTSVTSGGDGEPHSAAFTAYSVNGLRLISTTVMRWTACIIHGAATEFHELHAHGPHQEPVGVDALHMLRYLGPGLDVPNLVRSELDSLELADFDDAGLQPMASLLG